MAVKAMQWGLSLKLRDAELSVLLNLCDMHNRDSGKCCPSLTTLIDRTGYGESTVKGAIVKLEKSGILQRVPRKSKGRDTSNQYNLNFDYEFEHTGKNQQIGGQPTGPSWGQPTDPSGGQPTDPSYNEPEEGTRNIEPTSGDDDQSNSKKIAENNVDQQSGRFSEFWEAYPNCQHKVGKAKSKQLFELIVSGKHETIEKTTADSLIDALKRYVASGPDVNFIPMPTTWLNGEKWLGFPEDQEPRKRRRFANDWEEVEI